MYIYTDGLETERLHTRFLKPEDAETWMEYVTDPIATTFMPNDAGLSYEDWTKHWIAFSIKRYREQRYGLQALIHKETGAFIGLCGLLLQEVNDTSEVEIGYHLFRKNWGLGYASEAAQMFRDYAFENEQADSVISIIHPLNFQSKNVAKRNGMTLSEKGVMFRDKEVDVFRITREEWQRLKGVN